MADKNYIPINEVSLNRDIRVPVEIPNSIIFTLDDSDVKTLKIEVLGAYIENNQWKVHLVIGEKREVFTGGLKISTDSPHKLFVRFRLLGNNTDLYLE